MESRHSEISLRKSIIPIVLLISLLFYNIIFFENNDWLGDYTYHYILIFTSMVATSIGLSEKIKDFEHHNLFFDKDFDKHLDEIFVKKKWPKDPLFYVCCPSKTDSSTVPSLKHENLFILVPIGPGSSDEENIRNVYFKKILSRIETKVNQKIEDKIIFKKSFCVNDFKSRYNAYNGNAYGLANTLFQTAIFKPKMKDAKIKNLYYSGHFTVPGPGLPPAIISGRIASKQIIKDAQI